jgi:hypothetical protein
MSPHSFGVTNNVLELSHCLFVLKAFSHKFNTQECHITYGVPPTDPMRVWGFVMGKYRVTSSINIHVKRFGYIVN